MEPGWQRKHLERHWKEGRRKEREGRARHANSSALPPSNQNRIPGRPRPVRKERGQESRASGVRASGWPWGWGLWKLRGGRDRISLPSILHSCTKASLTPDPRLSRISTKWCKVGLIRAKWRPSLKEASSPLETQGAQRRECRLRDNSGVQTSRNWSMPQVRCEALTRWE